MLTGNLGLSQDLIDAVKSITEASCSSKKMEKEELVGGQKKIDKNGNGKLDADDFKKLRKEETVEEEVEELDELSKGTLANYTQKAAHDVGNKMRKSGVDTGIASQLARTQDKKELGKTFEKDAAQSHSKALTRLQGIKTATKKLSQEQVEEIEALAAKHGLGE